MSLEEQTSLLKDVEEMNSFCIELASHCIEIKSLFKDTQALCQNYISCSQSEFTVATTRSDIALERRKSEAEDIKNGYPLRHFSDGYLETLAVYRKIAEHLIQDNILLFHGSAIFVDGEAYLFTAPSGTGKSTHVRLWREYLGERAVMINDDKPLLEIAPSGVTVYGTPWDGKHRLSNNIAVPLKAICNLERGQTNTIHQISSREAYPLLLQQTYRPADREKMMKTLTLVNQLSHSVRLYRLSCNMDSEAAEIAYRGMNGGTL